MKQSKCGGEASITVVADDDHYKGTATRESFNQFKKVGAAQGTELVRIITHFDFKIFIKTR